MPVSDLDDAVVMYKQALAERDNRKAEKATADDVLAAATDRANNAAAALSTAQALAIEAKDHVVAAAEALAAE